MRKRWPAIKPKPPHWRALYQNGRLGEPMEHGEARGFARIMRRAGRPLAAIVKITLK